MVANGLTSGIDALLCRISADAALALQSDQIAADAAMASQLQAGEDIQVTAEPGIQVTAGPGATHSLAAEVPSGSAGPPRTEGIVYGRVPHVLRLFDPDLGPGFRLANSPYHLPRGSQRYYVQVAGHRVRVMLAKCCFQICNSPPPVAECRNAINSRGELTIGFHNSMCKAWVLVLKVLGLDRNGQPRWPPAPPGQGGQPQPNAAPPVYHEVPEVTAGGGST
jgi:hypothetical protein